MTGSGAGGIPERLRRALEAEGPAEGLEFRLPPERLRDWAGGIRAHGLYLVFITAVDLDPAPEVIYQFAAFERACRVTLLVSSGPERSVPSIADIYQGADWHEREAYEFFGITFQGHPQLKPLILSRAEKKLRPLLKSARELRRRADLFAEGRAGGPQPEGGRGAP